MRRIAQRCWQVTTAVWIAVTLSCPAHGEVAFEGVPTLSAQWLARDLKPTIVIPLVSALSPRQRSIIEGGFTTLSQLTLRTLDDEDPEQYAKSDEQSPLPIVQRVRCSVKFDAWEETYDVARLESESKASTQPALVKNFQEYSALCLTGELENSELLRRYDRGGILLAWLIIKQTSYEEAARIKSWLIQQQSGVMQGLFSHMLGELTLSQRVLVRIIVPPRPERLENIDAKFGDPTITPASTKG